MAEADSVLLGVAAGVGCAEGEMLPVPDPVPLLVAVPLGVPLLLPDSVLLKEELGVLEPLAPLESAAVGEADKVELRLPVVEPVLLPDPVGDPVMLLVGLAVGVTAAVTLGVSEPEEVMEGLLPLEMVPEAVPLPEELRDLLEEGVAAAVPVPV